VKEMQQASLWNDAGMANLVQLVPYKGIQYYKNPTVADQKAFGAPGELLFNAKGNKQLALHVEKVMHVNVLYREKFYPREDQASTADSREWYSETSATLQNRGSLLCLG